MSAQGLASGARASVSTEVNCGLCKNILKVPQQTSCCGSHFCFYCLKGRLESGQNVACPTCKEKNISYFRNKSLEKQISLSIVACNQDGCTWTGEYGKLEAHSEQCDFVKVKCEFSDVGCPANLPKMEMQTHLRKSMGDHVRLLHAFMTHKLASLQTHLSDKTEMHFVKKEVHDVQGKLKTMQSKIEMIEGMIMTHKLLPYMVIIPSIDQYIYGSQGEEWRSPEFYTGSHDNKGYKLQLRIVPNSISYTSNKEKALSARLFLAEGNSSGSLTWPFYAKFSLKIIDPSGINHPYVAAGRHTWKSSEDETSMWFQAFIAHKDLLKYTEYDGSLHILVTY